MLITATFNKEIFFKDHYQKALKISYFYENYDTQFLEKTEQKVLQF